MDSQDKYQLLSYVRFIKNAQPLAMYISKARFLAYSNEVGEALRHSNPKFIIPLYGISGIYILSDIGTKIHNEKK